MANVDMCRLDSATIVGEKLRRMSAMRCRLAVLKPFWSFEVLSPAVLNRISGWQILGKRAQWAWLLLNVVSSILAPWSKSKDDSKRGGSESITHIAFVIDYLSKLYRNL